MTATAQKNMLKPIAHQWVAGIQEPSDISVSKNGYFMVSDHGKLYATDATGKVLQKATEEGADYEGVYAWNDKVYVSEESFRKVCVYDALTLKFISSYPVNYSGGRNDGVEAICRNETKNCFVLITEKNPSVLFETDTNFQIISERPSPVEEVSAVTWHNGSLYILSDEAHTVYKVDPTTYSILAQWPVMVTNPEGICFNSKGELIILSDDRAMFFTFNLPQQ
jgi:uncharacterized protein YjiK